MERSFVDEARIEVAAGNGGNGCVSFDRAKHKPRGRPDGGNGGNGGSVILRVDPGVATLGELARRAHVRARHGKHGSGSDRHGAAGLDELARVPDGTVVRGEDGQVIADLVGGGTEVVAARGGRGGRGNAAFAGARRRAPGFAERGERGERRRLSLELKVLADVGLVGLPNAGKSSLVARLSAARPKVAAYPFTTLTPNLGVAEVGETRFVVADVPGLVEGAHEGKGLGLGFLRHLERCRVLCFVLDTAADDARAQLEALRAELRAHMPAFDDRVGVVVANKIDLPGTRAQVDAARAAAVEAGFPSVAVSALRGDGVGVVAGSLAEAVRRAEEREPPRLSHRLIRLRPEPQTVEIAREEGAWRVRSPVAERLVGRFELDNPDALAFVQGRLVAIGVEDALERAGARAGDEVRIAGVAFEFTPERAAEAEGE